MKTVFIVEDDTMYQLILKHLIMKEHADAVVSTFSNGLPAITEIKKIESEKGPMPDIILLDINMPIMDGWQFLDTVNGLGPDTFSHTDIYIISSSLDVRDRERAIANPYVKEYIYKPVTPEQLAQMLH